MKPKPNKFKQKFLSKEQKKIARLAVPYDEITAQDLEILRSEKKNTKRS